MKLLLLISILFFGCGKEPVFTTGHHTFYGYMPPAQFLEDVYKYQVDAFEKFEPCADLNYPELDPEVWMVDWLVEEHNASGMFLPTKRILIQYDYCCPMAVFGHEYVRFLLYHNSEQWWAHSSNDWQSGPMSCLWNSAQTLSLDYDPEGCEDGCE